MPDRIITLTTDFGEGSPYVAEMKGVILSSYADAKVVDISHSVAPQNIREGALVLEQTTPHFPPGSIHIAVVDPGVGTDRRVVYACIDQRHYLAPDNGLLGLLIRRRRASSLIALTKQIYWRPDVSNTFHGRDMMAPVAAHLALGVDPQKLGDPLPMLTPLDWPEPEVVNNRIEATICFIDSFGNLISNIEADWLASRRPPGEIEILLRNRRIEGLKKTYGEAAQGELIALMGSSGRLEVAQVGGNAQRLLGARTGEKFIIS